jgi:hypothetical protein
VTSDKSVLPARHPSLVTCHCSYRIRAPRPITSISQEFSFGPGSWFVGGVSPWQASARAGSSPRLLIGWQTLAVNGESAPAVLSSGVHGEFG